jgi:hypothetical protein
VRSASTLLPLCFAFPIGACTPDIGVDPTPEVMEFDTLVTPPRVPEPTHVIINPVTKHIDFRLAGIAVPADCAAPGPMPQAQCEFYQYLQSLDGYPTVTPARAPASAALDPASLTPQNVVVVDAVTRQVVPDIPVTFDGAGRYVVLSPPRGWDAGHLYMVGVRGYATGVKGSSGQEVVASVPYYLLKQDSSLTCGATTPDAIPETCPPFVLLATSMGAQVARAAVLQLEALRGEYNRIGITDLLAAAGGIQKSELAVYWAFPTHSGPVAELDPKTGKIPKVMGDNQIQVAVKGPVDPATLRATTAGKPGTVTLMDLTATAGANLVAGLPPFDVAYDKGSIVLTTRMPLVPGHQYGVFLSNGVLALDGKPMVPSPVSVLLTARGKLVDAAGKSQVSSVADADAAALEVGRLGLADLLDNQLIQTLTGLDRSKLTYVFAFPFGGQ